MYVEGMPRATPILSSSKLTKGRPDAYKLLSRPLLEVFAGHLRELEVI